MHLTRSGHAEGGQVSPPSDGYCGVNELQIEDCIRCGEAPPADESGYCGHCYWSAKAEFEEGFYELRSYLEHWRKFRDWELGGTRS